MKTYPVVFVWHEVDVINQDGIARRCMAQVPIARYARVAAKQFVAGQEYPMQIVEARSRASHNHFFAELNELFENLPENLALIAKMLGITTMPPTGFENLDHFRHWSLCETKWCEVDEFDFDTKEEAMRLARFYRKRDKNYSQISVRGSHVTIKTPLSQSAAAMGKEAFEKSKRDVLDLAQAIVGVTRSASRQAAGRSA